MKKEAHRCTRCILPSSYPRISFDAEGVCSYCRAYESRWKDWEAGGGESELLKIVQSAKKRNPWHSALVGITGGMDSTYTLHLLVKRYGLNVLTFTYDNGFLADGARENIDKIVKKLNVEHRFVSIERDVRQRMYRALFKRRCADFCQICMLGVLAGSNHLALKENIPMVVWGVSPRTDPVTPLELFLGNDYRYLLDVVEPEVKRSEFPLFKNTDILRMLHIMFVKRIRLVFLPQYLTWNEKEISELIRKEYGWTDYGQGVHHFDCGANAAVNYFMMQRFGFSKVVEKLSQLVRSGQMAREEALEKYHGQEQTLEPVDSVNEVCRRLGVVREELEYLLDGKSLDYRHFKSYSRLIEQFSWLLWITCKLGLTKESLYRKYSWNRT